MSRAASRSDGGGGTAGTAHVAGGPSALPLTLAETVAHALRYWRPHLPVALLLLAALAVPQAYKAFFAYSQRIIVDRGLLAHDAAVLARVLVALAAGFLLAGAAQLAADYLGARVAAAIVNEIRARMFRHLQRLSLGYYSRTRTGDIVARFTSDLADIQKSLTTRVVDAAFAVIGLVITVPVAFSLEWRLATVMVLGMPVAGLGTRLFGRRAAAARYALKQQEAAVASTVQESARAQPVVKAFSLAGWLLDRFHALLGEVGRRHARAEFAAELVGTSSSLGVLAVQVLVIGVGAYLAFSGSLTAGTLVAFISLHAVVSKDAYDLTKKVVPALISSSGGLQRIEELLGEPVEVESSPAARDLAGITRGISFEHVGFAYGDGRAALDDVSLEIKAGERVALVGPSGSGKSTVVSLLLRFFDPGAGRITADGADLREVTLESLHEQMAAVFQESFLFAGTIGENIALGRLGATAEEVRAAARAAEIDELVASLPDGYDTQVGELGGRLSGGQRQRVAIARAILRNPAVLVLDEATSALDPATEAAVNATLERLSRGRMTVSVTHRLASARTADRIVVLDRGRVVESGSHEELLAAGGLYRQLWEKQSGVGVSEDGSGASIRPERLAAIPIFAGLDDAGRERLAARLAVERRDGGEEIVREGEAGDRFFVVARGKVEVVVGGGEAARRVAVLSDGDFFGEMALLAAVPRAATVRTLVPCVFLTLGAKEFQALLAESPGLRAAVDKVVRARKDLAADPLAALPPPQDSSLRSE